MERMMFIFGGQGSEPTPEEIEKYKREADLVAMKREESYEKIWELLEGMDAEQLITMRNLLINLETPAERGMADGILITLLRTKFRVCESCGVDHAQEGLDKLMAESEPAKGKTIVEESDPAQTFEDELPSRDDLMRQYGVKPRNSYPEDVAVACIECGIINPSLEDRTLRPPMIAGCLGCQLKSSRG